MGKIHIQFSINLEECSATEVEHVHAFCDVVGDGLMHALETAAAHVNHKVVVSKMVTEDSERTSMVQAAPDAPTEDEQWIALLKQYLVDADEVARRRGDKYGLCDSLVERKGREKEAYPSTAYTPLFERLKREGYKPMLFLKDLESSE